MSLEQLILLALIQGLTEFLPISSSGHLILFPSLTGAEDQGVLIDLAAHVGSLGAVVLYFWRDVRVMFVGAADIARFRFSTEAARLDLYLAVATIPLLLVGGVLTTMGAMEALRSPTVIAWATIIFGLALYAADKLGARLRTLENLTWGRAALVGCAQAIAVIPGTSRSGITITAARMLNFTRPEAARISMLMSIPAILAGGAFIAFEMLESGDIGQASDAVVVAGLSFVSAYISIFLFMKMLQRMSLTPFVIYRLLLGAGLLIWLQIA